MDKKFFFQIFGLIIVIFAATILTFNQKLIPNLGQRGTTIAPAPSVGGQTVLQILDSSTNQQKAVVSIEIADTQATRSLGLGNRASLPADNGMLFIMEQKARPTFWMKGMQFGLDFIWIDGNKIADIIPNVAPPVAGQTDQTLPLYSPTTAVDRVLEVNSGYVAAHGINIGDLVQVQTVVNPSP